MNNSTTSSDQGEDPDKQTDQPLPSLSCALKPLNSQQLTSEQNSQQLTSEQNSQQLTSEQNSQQLTSEQNSQQLTSEQNSQPSTSEQFDRQDVGPPPHWHHNQESGQHPNKYYNSEPRQHGQPHAGSTPQNMPYFTERPCPHPPPQGAHRTVTGPEVHHSRSAGLTDKAVRTKFVRKVYVILMSQLLFTMGIIALFVFEPNVKQFARSNKYLIWMAFVILSSVYMGLACSTSMNRNSAYNVISLIVFTTAMSYLAGTLSSFFNTEGVLLSEGICAAVSLAVSIFSYYIDFTSCLRTLGILLISCILPYLGFGIIVIFYTLKVMTMIYAAFGAVVFSLYLALYTQMLLGGRTYELSPDEYVFPAILIYGYVIIIFMHLLLLIQPSK